MAKKTKKKSSGSKRGASLKLEMKAKRPRPVNPFELKFSQSKHSVLNRKHGGLGGQMVEALGHPGKSRQKALQKRKETLLNEYKTKHKSNVLLDRRIGEADPKMAQADKMMARFAAERRKGSSIFNLGDDDDRAEVTLTHGGRSLADIEAFEDPRSEGEEDEQDEKHLNAAFVSEAHFGGFMTKADAEFAEGKGNTRKDWIEKMIADSKKRKAEQQKKAEETEILTEDLNASWKAMWGKIRVGNALYGKREGKVEGNEQKVDAYDQLMRELQFEGRRKVATDRTKTAEELIQDEKKRLEALETDRQRRMIGQTSQDVEEDMEQAEEGSDEQEEGSDEEEEGSDEEEEGSDEEDDQNSDLMDSEEEEEKTPKSGKSAQSAKKKKSAALSDDSRLQMMETARREIPYTFSVPAAYEELQAHFEARTPQELVTITQRIIQCNHPQFGNGNKEKLQKLFTFLLQTIHDAAEDFEKDEQDADGLQIVNGLVPFLYDLAQFSPAPSAQAVLHVLQEKFEDNCRKARTVLGLDTVVFIKIAFLLFPASDYRHPVATPATQLAAQFLASGRFNSRRNIALGLLTATMLLESIQISKRYLPELVNFLTGILYISVPKKADEVVAFLTPFKVIGNESVILASHLSKRSTASNLKWSDAKVDGPEIDPPFAAGCLKLALSLLSNLADLWSKLPSFREIFAFATNFLERLQEERVPKEVWTGITDLKEKLNENSAQTAWRPITVTKEKPKILKLYEPEIENNFDPYQKKRVGSKEKLEMGKLKHKLKRERKGARKDLRADSAFIAKQKAKERKEKDDQRKQKTKELLAGLGSQEGEFRKMLKAKNKSRR